MNVLSSIQGRRLALTTGIQLLKELHCICILHLRMTPNLPKQQHAHPLMRQGHRHPNIHGLEKGHIGIPCNAAELPRA